MGNKITIEKFNQLKHNYLEGINNKKNFDIDQIFVTLIMKLNYYQTRSKLCKIPLINEATTYSNPINSKYFQIPNTFDFISGLKVINKNNMPCTIKILWNHKLSEENIILDTFIIKSEQTEEFILQNLYINIASSGNIIVTSDSDNVFIKYKCGIHDIKILRLLGEQKCSFINSIGEKFDYISGSLNKVS